MITPPRQERWRAAWAHEKSRRLLRTALTGRSDHELAVPVRQADGGTAVTMLHHIVQATADVVIDTRPGTSRTVTQMLDELDRYGAELELELRRRTGWARGVSDRQLDTPAVHLAVHVAELHEALGIAKQPQSSALRHALGVLCKRLAVELSRAGLPALALDDGLRIQILGIGEPVARLQANGHPLLFALAGRLNPNQLRGLNWSADPQPYMAVLANLADPPCDQPHL